MDIRINELSDRELLENIFYQNLLINKKLNAFFEINEELRDMYNKIENDNYENEIEEDINKTVLLYKEHKCILNEDDVINFKKTFNIEPCL